jgi:uncharacterized protein involved in response to NO
VAAAGARLSPVLPAGRPVVYPAGYSEWILGSGVLWLLAFALFTLVYAPILLRRRADGRPG